MKVISIKGRTMIYLFFMVIKFCWRAFLCLKFNLIAIANLGSGCVIETSNLDTDISEMNFVGCKGQTKSWNDVQTSENMQNLEFLPKNAFILCKLCQYQLCWLAKPCTWDGRMVGVIWVAGTRSKYIVDSCKWGLQVLCRPTFVRQHIIAWWCCLYQFAHCIRRWNIVIIHKQQYV